MKTLKHLLWWGAFFLLQLFLNRRSGIINAVFAGLATVLFAAVVFYACWGLWWGSKWAWRKARA